MSIPIPPGVRQLKRWGREGLMWRVSNVFLPVVKRRLKLQPSLTAVWLNVLELS